MAKRTDLDSILIIGAGPIIIGQACEFDYSGAQACKALKEEGYRVILVNSNPATIMTDPETADAIYIEPINWRTLARIIEKERPTALLPTMGGQTALNTALDLVREGILDKFNVEMIGASQRAIDMAEDRELFRRAMADIGLETARARIAHSMEEALAVQAEIGFPTVIRPSFTLGGSGGGIAYNREEFEATVARGLDASPTNEVLLEESVLGWKEYEMEVVRDHDDNCIIVCSIENIDPMGVHTGDSITVAPAQTLTDREYQRLRDASIAVLRKIGVDTGGSNVQFAINPDDGRVLVIEMNPRVSRSSALASKATGFPIAKIAAKLAVGYTLNELKNEITGGGTPASFEPTIDYVVTKIPRFTFEKFPGSNTRLTTQMKSVGEAMAIGRTFQESMQKALRSLETGLDGFNEQLTLPLTDEAAERLAYELRWPGPNRILYVADAFRAGWTRQQVFDTTKIDPWFLAQIEDLLREEALLAKEGFESLELPRLRALKRKGFSDARIAKLTARDEATIRSRRRKLGLHPVYKCVDTCAAEFSTSTAYLYSTYEEECEANPSSRRKILILGGGPNRIGQGIEFDYCCVHAAMALREDGFETLMVNCNPETVSTDYDTSDRLYFEPLTFEDVWAIYQHEASKGASCGVIVQFGGQTPLNLALPLKNAGVNIIGTSPESIDLAEDRKHFNKLLEELKIPQAAGVMATSLDEAVEGAKQVGYPVVVRPSYVLGGRAMVIAYDEESVVRYMKEAVEYSHDRPVLIDNFLEDAIEIDVDALSDGEDVVIGGIMQHIEEAGIHSGDSSCVLPAVDIPQEQLDCMRDYTFKLARALKVIGLMNIQFAIPRGSGGSGNGAEGGKVYVLEVNPRASRTVPYVSKATGVPLAKIAARLMTGRKLREFLPENIERGTDLDTGSCYYVKSPVFPWSKFPGVDTVLGPEMKSTGEVMGVGDSFGEAVGKAQLAAGQKLPTQGTVFLSVTEHEKRHVADLARKFVDMGFKLVATSGTGDVIEAAGMKAERVYKVKEGRPNVVDFIKGQRIHLIVNTPTGLEPWFDEKAIRRAAVMARIPTITTLSAARAAAEGIAALQRGEVRIRALQQLHAERAVKSR